MGVTRPRSLHPGAWWGWAIGMAVAVSQTNNPLLLGLAIGSMTVVVLSRRGDTPWARSFRLYALLGGFIVTIRIALYVLVGIKGPGTVLLDLPTIGLPAAAAGITLLGPITAPGLLGAALGGLRLATIMLAIGAANSLANPKRLLRSLPRALSEVGTAAVVAVSVAPQLVESIARVRRAQALRGRAPRGLAVVPAVAVPVLEDTLDRSLLLAAAMDARGYGRLQASPAALRTAHALSFAGISATAIGVYGVLDASTASLIGAPLLAAGVSLVAASMWWAGRGIGRTAYRPDPWLAPEWFTVLCGLVPAAAFLWLARTDPSALAMPLEPLAPPALPTLGALALLVAAVPAYATPPPPRPGRAVAPSNSNAPDRGAAHV